MKEYPDIDLHTLVAAYGVDLNAATQQLLAIYADVDARNARNTANLQLPCHKGCDMCCHESVFLTPLEFFCAWQWAQENISRENRQQIIERGLALYQTHQALIEALEEPPAAGQKDHFLIAQKIRFRCPLLSDAGTCQIYPVRELLARIFGCSFNEEFGVYGCYLVANHLAGQTVTLLPARGTARRLHDLPLTSKRQVYPYYLHMLYGQ